MYTLLGLRPYNFTDEKTGKQVAGVSVFLGSQIDSAQGFGVMPIKKSISSVQFSEWFGNGAATAIGKSVDAYFDANGKIALLQLGK